MFLFCPSTGDQNPQQHKAWYYTAADGTKQNAGFVKAYDQITFVTVRVRNPEWLLFLAKFFFI